MLQGWSQMVWTHADAGWLDDGGPESGGCGRVAGLWFYGGLASKARVWRRRFGERTLRQDCAPAVPA